MNEQNSIIDENGPSEEMGVWEGGEDGAEDHA